MATLKGQERQNYVADLQHLNQNNIQHLYQLKILQNLIVFLIVSPVIGMVMLLGVIATSVAMICMYIKEFIMKRFYE